MVAALAARATARSKPRIEYKRGLCPCCKQPMLVSSSHPDAPCVGCYEKPQLAISAQLVSG